MRDGALLLVAVIAVLIGNTLPSKPIPQLAVIAPIAYALAILGNLATAVVLFSLLNYYSVRPTLVLALSFAASSVMLFFATLMLPLLPLTPPLLPASLQSGLWLYVFWHITPGAGALVYIFLRHGEQSTIATRRFTIAAVTATILVVAGFVFASLVLVRWLPALVVGEDVSGLVSTGVGPASVIILATAGLLAYRIQPPSLVNRALAFSLVAVALEMSILLVGGHRFSAKYYAGRVLLALGPLSVLIAAIRELILARSRLHSTERAYAELSDVSSKRAGRIRALWEIATQVGRPVDHVYDELLRTATAAIRPGKMMCGILSHVDDDNNTIVIDATSWSAPQSQGLPLMDTVYPGATFPLSGSLTESLLATPGTVAWNDLRSSHGNDAVWQQVGLQSYIGRYLNAGRRTYFIAFASLEPMIDEPYAEDDTAYVDVVASFFEARFSETLHYERLQFQIEHDALTGLRNRAQFRNAIRSELAAGSPFAIAFVNLDEFRLVNERDGHMLGDEVLVEVAATLAGVNANNLIARMNGDEFGILLRCSSSRENVDRVLDDYARQFLKPFQTGDRDGTRLLQLSASIGAARHPDDGASPEELMRRADLALSIAKDEGGARTIVFDRSMEATLEATRMRFAELSDAIAKEQLVLVYQPTFDLATRAVTGAEALVRWDHPERGRVAPSEFVPFAERNGLIGQLTRWVFQRVRRDISGGVSLPHGFRVYFNVVAQTLDDLGFIAEVNDALRTTPNLASHIGIELTESAAMQNIESAMHTINILRKWGLSVAVDDFGTGYSSLSYLKKLTVDVIKIDRSFVVGLPDDERDGAITELLLQITDRFGVATLAEGIETEAQAQWLVRHGCRYGQGFLLAKPDSFAALQERLRESPTVAASAAVSG